MDDSRLQQLQAMLAQEPDDSFLVYALALEYAKSNNVNKAIEVLENLIGKDAVYLGSYYQLGKYYEQTEQLPKAADIYTQGIAIAQQQNNKKILGELNTALLLLDE